MISILLWDHFKETSLDDALFPLPFVQGRPRKTPTVKRIEHERHTLIKINLKIDPHKPSLDELKDIPIDSWISVSGSYEDVGVVYDVGQIKAVQLVEEVTSKGKKKQFCTVSVQLPDFDGGKYDYPISLSDHRSATDKAPGKSNLWRLVVPDDNIEGTTASLA